MNEDEFGLVFKEVRKQKGFKVSSFEKLGVSRSRISRFENGKGFLDIAQLYACLHEMKVALYEYEAILRRFDLEDYEKIFSGYYEAYYQQDSLKLKRYFRETHDPLLKMAIKCLYFYTLSEESDGTIQQLTEVEKDYIIDYLFEITRWGFYELMILNCTINTLGSKRVIQVLKEFREQTENYHTILHYQRLIIQILIKGAFALVRAGKKTSSRRVLDQSFRLAEPTNLFSRLLCRYVEAVWSYRFINREEGRKEIKKEIEILKTLKSNDLAGFYQSVFEKNFHEKL